MMIGIRFYLRIDFALLLIAAPLFARLTDVAHFTYQLQEIDLNAMAATGFDLAVIDYSSDGCESGEFTAAQVEGLKHGSGGEKIILSYMSIGEAEDYRFYWQDGWRTDDPAWLDAENPDWGGNYKVRFWEAGWQAIIFAYLNRILDTGFDGVYLDIIDAYEYYESRGRATAAQEMADFVKAIGDSARQTDPDFIIIPQNAAELGTFVPGYLDDVDGIGQEDIYYGYNSDGIATPAPVSVELEGYLNVFRDAGKVVLTVDYPFDDEDVPDFNVATVAKIDDAYAKSTANGYVPYCTVRNLNFLTVNPGHEPVSAPVDEEVSCPDDFDLSPNYPNPFNGSTHIRLTVPHDATGTLGIWDIQGRVVRTLTQGKMQAGTHTIHWNGLDDAARPVTSGVYILRCESEDKIFSRKLILVE